MKTVFLVGFMGSGKTTFGKKLAPRLQLQFVDLDKQIALACSQPDVNTLIEKSGFDFFRKTEAETLKAIDLKDKLIATGGGTPCYFENMDWMKQHGKVVFLQVDEGVLFSRLKTTNLNERPLLKNLDEEGLKKFIGEKLNERMPFYTQAHIMFNPITGNIDDLVKLL